jgi:hypothetical protein
LGEEHIVPTPRKPRPLCLCGCNREVPRPTYKFFSNQCQQNFEYQEFIARWKDGKESGIQGKLGAISKHIKRYLRAKFDNKCKECGWSQQHPLTQIVPVEVDHINGNATDNQEENLRLLCPNCHSLTPNYRALNRGRGRPNRR